MTLYSTFNSRQKEFCFLEIILKFFVNFHIFFLIHNGSFVNIGASSVDGVVYVRSVELTICGENTNYAEAEKTLAPLLNRGKGTVSQFCVLCVVLSAAQVLYGMRHDDRQFLFSP